MFQIVRLKKHNKVTGKRDEGRASAMEYPFQVTCIDTYIMLSVPDLSVVTRLPFRGIHLLSKKLLNLI